MRFVIFCHSLVSDWNHGNAHFLRGVVSELQERDHEVAVWEPRDGWSRSQLAAERGASGLQAFAARYPGLHSQLYDEATLDLDDALSGADVVIVHEWNTPSLIGAVALHRRRSSYVLLFQDTHHRAVSDPDSIARLDLGGYDAVLAFGSVLRDVYLARGWCARAFTWHEAADVRLFRPLPAPTAGSTTDLVWVGNWGDEERTRELEEFLIEPVRALHLHAEVYGVRYPPEVQEELASAGLHYRGWLANGEVPDVFARARVTVHIPRRPYTEALPGIPTIRPFEALACGIPLVSAPWDDRDGLFTAGRDYLVARDGAEMRGHLARLLASPAEAGALAAHGRQTIEARHTCAHRVDELLQILGTLAARPAASSGGRDTRAA